MPRRTLSRCGLGARASARGLRREEQPSRKSSVGSLRQIDLGAHSAASPRRRSAGTRWTASRCPRATAHRDAGRHEEARSEPRLPFLELPDRADGGELRRRAQRRLPGRRTTSTEENVQGMVPWTGRPLALRRVRPLVVATGEQVRALPWATPRSTATWPAASASRTLRDRRVRLARHLNERAGRELIPPDDDRRAPSAELRPSADDETPAALRRAGPRARTSSSTAPAS